MTVHRPFSPVPPARSLRLSSPDGTEIAVYEWGDEHLPAIILLHGVYQSALSWHRQFSDAGLTGSYRIVAVDLRGHGGSDKPNGETYYRDAQRWADDVKVVIDHCVDHGEPGRPVLAGWSFGGRVINDYLSVYGDAALGGIIYVGARSISTQPDEPPLSTRFMTAGRYARSDDPLELIKGTRQFVRLCFHQVPARQELDALAMNSMQTPLYVRNQIMGRRVDYDATIKAIRVPTLIAHGRQDMIINFRGAELTAAMIKHATFSAYDDAGHAPFAEDPDRFNRELKGFMQRLPAAR